MGGPYPLASLSAQVTPAGISAPSFNDIYQSLLAQLQTIYGSDIVTDASTQDIQLISATTQAIYDANNTLIAIYNGFRPGQSTGVPLSSLVKINGLARLIASNSSSPIEIGGTAGTIITNGIVGDGTYQWALPASITIPSNGSIIETATCTTIGAISAPAGTINQIITPQRGWQTAVSTADAAIGAPVEADSTLTQRQAVSTALPAQTPLEAIVGNLENLAGVTALMPYENDTNETDGNGLPPHSIAMVVEGGDAVSVATIIAQKKAPGSYTYGTTSEVIIDPTGVPLTINFFIPTQLLIDVTVTITPQTGYVSTTGTLISAQVSEYLSSLGIGGADGFVFYSKLFSPANDTGSLANTYNVTSIAFGVHGESLGTSNIPVPFNNIVMPGTITVTVT